MVQKERGIEMCELKPVAMGRVRAQCGMTRAALARAANMQAGVITWIETGRYIPYDSQLQKIAAALGVDDPESLLEPLAVAS